MSDSTGMYADHSSLYTVTVQIMHSSILTLTMQGLVHDQYPFLCYRSYPYLLYLIPTLFLSFFAISIYISYNSFCKMLLLLVRSPTKINLTGPTFTSSLHMNVQLYQRKFMIIMNSLKLRKMGSFWHSKSINVLKGSSGA